MENILWQVQKKKKKNSFCSRHGQKEQTTGGVAAALPCGMKLMLL